MNKLTGAAMLMLAGGIVLRGAACRANVYGAFLRGAEKGMKSTLSLLPALCAMLMMVSLVNASGLAECLSRLLAPVTGLMHLPEEITPILLLRPLSGAGSLAALEAVFEHCGPDSRPGRIASVLMGSSETVFYTMTVYLAAAGVRKLPHVIGVSLTSYLLSAALCGWLM